MVCLGTLCTETVPWWAETTAETIASPSPVLGVSLPARVRDASPRAKRSNTRGSICGAIPGPVSVTVRLAPPPGSAASPTVTVVACGVWPGVQPGQQQQVLDQCGHPLGLRGDPDQGVRGARRDRVPLAAGQLGVAADRGQGRTQLVAGAGDEPAQPGLGVPAGGERALDVVQHPVQRRADLADLGPRVRVRDPGGQVHLAAVQRQRTDLPGDPGHPLQRPQLAADQHRRRDPGQHDRAAQYEHLDQDQPPDHVRDVVVRAPST